MEDIRDEPITGIESVMARLIDQASASLRPGERLTLQFNESLGSHSKTYRVEREVPAATPSPNTVSVMTPEQKAEQKAKLQALIRSTDPGSYPGNGFGGCR